MKAADVVNIKLPRCGGIYRSQKIATMCENSGIPCFLGGCLETTPGAAAQLQFYASTSNVVSALEMGPWHYVDDIVASPLTVENGFVAIPDSHGMGFIIDENKVARYRVDP
jgi:L-alanine-DL-glutamate epimerase-like enolase superfamily enzyme